MDARLRFAEFLLDVACAFLIAAVLMVGSANAAVGYGGCSMPGQMCIQGNSVGVDVSVRQSGNGVPQTPSAGVMSVLVPITIGVAAVGAAAVAIPATGAIAIAGDAIAAAGMAAIRSHVIQGAALGAVIAAIAYPSGISLDSNGNVVAPAVSSSSGDVGFNGTRFCDGSGTFCGNSAMAACQAFFAAGLANGTWNASTDKLTDVQMSANGMAGNCVGTRTPPGQAGWSIGIGGVSSAGSCINGYVTGGSGCVPDPNADKQPVSDAQLQSAIKASPTSWPSIYNGMNCGPTLALTNGSTSDPCYGLYNDSRTGFGVSFSTGGSSWTNQGCAVNSASCPSATVTTAPTTDSSTKVNADGSKTTTTNTTTKTTTVTGTNDRTNPVEGQTTTTTSTSTTVTNPDGSTTTTTTTTTDQAPPATAGNPANQQDKPQPTTATLASPDIKLYDKKTKTFADVLNAFGNTVRGSAIGAGVNAFFTINASGSCPQWVVPATDYTAAIALGPIFCSQAALWAYGIAGIAVLIGCAWVAFGIAFL
ncbi:hypothetical protein [Ralstonia sp.]|uniref:hypothetical protein n=1 Tax=Ralstonia sp. TaxID=54061 RepID=UPI002B6D97C6|nr:hypothetical protein [Ralstonia sp.]HWV03915.1 hypothetical protein [Ralstonia sp.]